MKNVEPQIPDELAEDILLFLRETENLIHE